MWTRGPKNWIQSQPSDEFRRTDCGHLLIEQKLWISELSTVQVLAGARFKEHSKDLCQRSKCMTNKYAFPGLHKCTTYNKGSKNHFTLIYIFGLDLSHLPKPDKTWENTSPLGMSVISTQSRDLTDTKCCFWWIVGKFSAKMIISRSMDVA